MNEVELDLTNIQDDIEELKDRVQTFLMNTEQEEVNKCKGWIESIEGHLENAETDIEFSLSLYRETNQQE